MTKLHLTATEKTLFEALSAELREGWTIIEEVQTFDDTNEHMRTRVSFMKIRDPKLNVFKEAIEKAKDEKAVAKLVSDFDLHDVHQSDLAELFFALGPKPLFQIIEMTIPQVKTDKEVESIAALSLIRNALLRSYIRNYA